MLCETDFFRKILAVAKLAFVRVLVGVNTSQMFIECVRRFEYRVTKLAFERLRIESIVATCPMLFKTAFIRIIIATILAFERVLITVNTLQMLFEGVFRIKQSITELAFELQSARLRLIVRQFQMILQMVLQFKTHVAKVTFERLPYDDVDQPRSVRIQSIVASFQVQFQGVLRRIMLAAILAFEWIPTAVDTLQMLF